MNRGHDASHHPDGVVQWLDQRRQTVGGTRRVGYHGVCRLQYLVVHTVDNRSVDILATRRRYDDFLCTTGKMRARFFLAGKKPCTFHHDINIQFVPGQLRGIPFRQYPDSFIPHQKAVSFYTDVFRKTAVGRVVLQQMGVGISIA